MALELVRHEDQLAVLTPSDELYNQEVQKRIADFLHMQFVYLGENVYPTTILAEIEKAIEKYASKIEDVGFMAMKGGIVQAIGTTLKNLDTTIDQKEEEQ